MRILIHGINYAPELTGIGKYTGEMAEWLAQRGHEVTVVTAPPYYPDWKVVNGYSAYRYRVEVRRGVKVWRCPFWVPNAPTGLKRILHLLSFACSSFPVLLRLAAWHPDVVLTIEPPLACAPQALLAARLCGAKAWLHVQDFEVEAFFGLGFSSSRLLQNVMRTLEGFLMRRFDRVSSISTSMVNRLRTLKVSDDRLSIMPNWVDTAHISPLADCTRLRSAWGLSDKQRIILYSGNMGRKQGLDIVLHAALTLSKIHPEVAFLMVGEGAAKADLVSQSRSMGLHNVHFHPLQPLESLPSLLALADVHLVIQKRGAADAVMPSKLTGIMAAGGFSIITADTHTELGKLVLNNPGIAELVTPEDGNALASAIIRLFGMRQPNQPFNVVARNYAEKYLATETVMNELDKNLHMIVSDSSLAS